jgi:hypothetical protein
MPSTEFHHDGDMLEFDSWADPTLQRLLDGNAGWQAFLAKENDSA